MQALSTLVKSPIGVNSFQCTPQRETAFARPTTPVGRSTSFVAPTTPTRSATIDSPHTPTTPVSNNASPSTPNAAGAFAVPATPARFVSLAAPRKSLGPSTSRGSEKKPFLNEEVLMTKREKAVLNKLNGTPKPKAAPKLAKTAPVSRKPLRFTAAKRILQSGEMEAMVSPFYNKKDKATFFEQVFELSDLIGGGAFGEVFSVSSRVDNLAYAVKVSVQLVSERCETTFREVVNHMVLPPHPNVVGFEDAWIEDGRLFIQQELCAGNLLSMLKKQPELPEDDIWNIVIDLVLAIDHLHSNDIVHCDIKPDNIFVTAQGVMKIGDFGLAVDLKKNDMTLTDDGDNRYLSPASMNTGPTKAGDIFSLGVTFLEVTTELELPSNGPLWIQIRDGEIPDRFFREYSNDLRAMIMQMISKIPAERPTIEELLNHPQVVRRLAARMAFIRSAEDSKMADSMAQLKEPRYRLDEEDVQIPRNLMQTVTIQSLVNRRLLIGKREEEGEEEKKPRKLVRRGLKFDMLDEEDEEASTSSQVSNSCPPILRNGQAYEGSPIPLQLGDGDGEEDKEARLPAKRQRRLMFSDS